LLKCVLKVPLLNGFCAEKLLVLTACSVISQTNYSNPFFSLSCLSKKNTTEAKKQIEE
jgi:hypothetical protein